MGNTSNRFETNRPVYLEEEEKKLLKEPNSAVSLQFYLPSSITISALYSYNIIESGVNLFITC